MVDQPRPPCPDCGRPDPYLNGISPGGARQRYRCRYCKHYWSVLLSEAGPALAQTKPLSPNCPRCSTPKAYRLGKIPSGHRRRYRCRHCGLFFTAPADSVPPVSRAAETEYEVQSHVCNTVNCKQDKHHLCNTVNCKQDKSRDKSTWVNCNTVNCIQDKSRDKSTDKHHHCIHVGTSG